MRVDGEVDGGVFAGVDSGVGREPGRRRGLGRRRWGFRIWGYVKMCRRHQRERECVATAERKRAKQRKS